MSELEKVYIKDVSSDRIHTRVIERFANGKGRILSDERCQKDQSGGSITIQKSEADAAAGGDLCDWCFPLGTERS